MDNKKITERYTRVFFEILKKNQSIEPLQEIKSLLELFQENPILEQILESHKKHGKEYAFIKKTLKEKLHLNNIFIDFLIYKNRADFFTQIMQEVFKLFEKENKILNISYYSAYPLDKEMEKILIENLSHRKKFSGKTINLSAHLSPDLIGGIKVIDKDYVYDLSIKSILTKFKKKLINNE